MISRAKFDGFHGWKVGKLGGELDPLETKQIHGSNPTKLHHTNISQIFWKGYLWWEFSILGRNQAKEG